MGISLQWTGAMIIVAGGHYVPQAYIVGGVIWLIGNILMWLGR